MKTIIQLLLLLFAQASSTAFAQPKILAMNVETTAPLADTTQYGVPVFDSTTVFTTVMNVILEDLTDIYQLHVKLGSTLHGSQFLIASFDYGVNGTFGSTSYSQTGNTILLGLGSYPGMLHYFAEVQIEKTDHTFQDAILFSKN
jgi:hypothetical protein